MSRSSSSTEYQGLFLRSGKCRSRGCPTIINLEDCNDYAEPYPYPLTMDVDGESSLMGAQRANRISDLDDSMNHDSFASDPLLQIRSETEYAPPVLTPFSIPPYYRPSPPSFRMSTPSSTSLSPRSTDVKGKGLCVCYGCGSPYHLKRQCPKRGAICYTCGKMGHIQKMCR